MAGGVDGAGQRGYHLLWYASQHGVTSIGPTIDGEQTFVLLDDWAPQQRELTREEAIATMALRYFRSHGPTTRKDFAGWTGLTAGDAKAGIAACGDALVAVTVDGVEMLASAELVAAIGGDRGTSAVHRTPRMDQWLALPGFDEYLLGYKDRSLMVDAAGMEAVIPGKNGIFRSTIVREGRVVGTWKRAMSPKSVTVDVAPLGRGIGRKDRASVEVALKPFAAFVGRDLVVRWGERGRLRRHRSPNRAGLRHGAVGSAELGAGCGRRPAGGCRPGDRALRRAPASELARQSPRPGAVAAPSG